MGVGVEVHRCGGGAWMWGRCMGLGEVHGCGCVHMWRYSAYFVSVSFLLIYSVLWCAQ